MHRILLALFRASEIEITAQAVGNAQIRLKDPAEHLLVEHLLKSFGGPQDGIGVRVFRLQIGDYFGVLLLAQPGVMIDATIAVHNGLNRLAARKRRRKRRTSYRVVRKRWRCCFGVWIHASLDLVRSAGWAPGIAPDLAGITLSKGEIRSSAILTEVRGGTKPWRA